MNITLSSCFGAVTLMAAAAAAPVASMAQSADGASITIYNGQHLALTNEWADGFTKMTGVKVVLRNAEDTELANQIIQEGAASPADVILTENSPSMDLLDQAGRFAPPPADTLAQVLDNFKPADGHWTGVAARSTAFVYNKNKLTPDQMPKSIMDLAGPSWKGRWGGAVTGADFQAIISAILELKGDAATLDWLKGMKANAKLYKGNGAALKAVNDGQVDSAVIYHYYFMRDHLTTGQDTGNSALYYFKNRDPGAFISTSGGGVLASSKHVADAQAFLKFITSKEGQTILAKGDSMQYAVGVGVPSNPGLMPLSDLQPPKVDPAKLNGKRVIDLITEAGLM
ncbi:MAG TPA: iron ABC transporter substrate-binding protein [Beijerinckiaceae bacterium]|nr:iron ABC transporter substrate-binding protein [Beijerinckiaceae bacterium]